MAACYPATFCGVPIAKNGRGSPLFVRFLSMVDAESSPSGCWLWTGSLSPTGYARMKVGPKPVMAHRVAYELFTGPLPAGLQIDHVLVSGCQSKSCVNPAHLEAVTQAENIRRVNHYNARKTHCSNGHLLAGRNLRLRNRRGSLRPMRVCVACKNPRFARQFESANGSL